MYIQFTPPNKRNRMMKKHFMYSFREKEKEENIKLI